MYYVISTFVSECTYVFCIFSLDQATFAVESVRFLILTRKKYSILKKLDERTNNFTNFEKVNQTYFSSLRIPTVYVCTVHVHMYMYKYRYVICTGSVSGWQAQTHACNSLKSNQPNQWLAPRNVSPLVREEIRKDYTGDTVHKQALYIEWKSLRISYTWLNSPTTATFRDSSLCPLFNLCTQDCVCN